MKNVTKVNVIEKLNLNKENKDLLMHDELYMLSVNRRSLCVCVKTYV